MYWESFLSKIEKHSLDYYLLATKSEFDSEYLPDYAKDLESIIGFSGSNGFCFVSSNKIILLTDGRYLLQAERQLFKLNIESIILNLQDTDFRSRFDEVFTKEITVGYNPRIFTDENLRFLKNSKIIYKPFEITVRENKPIVNINSAFSYDVKYCGLNHENKINLFTEKMKHDYYFFNCPGSICWLLNIRGQDVPYNLIFLCYAILEKSTKILTVFCDEPEKLSVIKNYKNVIVDDVKNLDIQLKSLIENKKIVAASKKTTIYYKNLSDNQLRVEDDYCNSLRSIKQPIEIDYSKNIHVKDGLAFINFWFWLENSLKNSELIDEIQICNKLEKFRAAQPDFFSCSFSTIAGFKGNGAIIHYQVNSETNTTIEGSGLLLIDSGGHYLGGTTDVTRVLMIGESTYEQKKHYTLVLKANLKMTNSIFPKNTPMHQLNSIGRYELWQEKMNFNHGLGHGVSNFIEVHESPYSINTCCTELLIENLILSNEPGFYSKNEYGIRIENLMYSEIIDGDCAKQFIRFVNLTIIPYDLRLIEKDLLNSEEIKQINLYHSSIYETMKNKLDEKTSQWLKEKTQPI